MAFPLRRLACLTVLLALTGLSVAAGPFADDPVSVAGSSSFASDSSPGEPEGKPSLWSRFTGAVRNGWSRVTTRLGKAIPDLKVPTSVTNSARIPGHDGPEFVCQGICHLPEAVLPPGPVARPSAPARYVLLSYYPVPEHTDEPSQLVVVEAATGKAVRRFGLYEGPGRPYTGHAGGVAVAGRYVWVASGWKLYGFGLEEVLDGLADAGARPAAAGRKLPASLRPVPALDLVADRIVEVDSKASFVSFDGTFLWVGDFVKASSGSFAPVAHHARNPFGWKTWIAGYRVDADGLPTATRTYTFDDAGQARTGRRPDRLLYCRESVQGMAVCGSYVALSISYGAMNSKLAFYRNPFGKAGRQVTCQPAGQETTFKVEAWTLAEGVNWLETVKLPAGAEDLEYDGRSLYVTFEGGSPNYRQKWLSINPTVSITDCFYVLDPAKELR